MKSNLPKKQKEKTAAFSTYLSHHLIFIRPWANKSFHGNMTYGEAQVRRGYHMPSDPEMTQPQGLLTTLRSGLNEDRSGCHKKAKVNSR